MKLSKYYNFFLFELKNLDIVLPLYKYYKLIRYITN